MPYSLLKKTLLTTFLFYPLLSSIKVVAASSICGKVSIHDLTNTDKNISEEEDIEALFNIKIASANQEASCAKQAANSVTVISGTEISNMGARDLIDVLQLVPGFHFGVDVDNVVGLGIRGIQAHEGKVSVFVDGINLTEHRYGNTPFGNHFPVHEIDHIEIIRGPGSIMHGNFAEMGVINIITKKAKALNGIKLNSQYGYFQRGEARKNFNLAAGKVWNDWEVSFSGKIGSAKRSDRVYQDGVGNQFDMAQNNEMRSLQGNLGIAYKNLSLRLFLDEYAVDSRDRFNQVDSGLFATNRFNTYAADLNYNYAITEQIKLDAQAYFSRQSPWELRLNSTDSVGLVDRVYADYTKLNLKTTFASQKGNYVVVGGGFSQDKFTSHVNQSGAVFPTFATYTAYTEGLYKTDWFNFLANLRFDHYSQYGVNWTPRIALTKEWGRFHAKALYSHAFRIPTSGNVQLNNQYASLTGNTATLRPEKTHTTELELGYQVTDNLSFLLNLFYIQIKNPIFYTVDEQGYELYANSKAMESRGIELAVNYKQPDWGYLNINYSFYNSARNTAVPYQITGEQGQFHKGLNLGFPGHKLTANAQLQVTNNLSLNQTLIFTSDRYSYSPVSLQRENAQWLYNVYLHYHNFFSKGLTVGVGLYDVFNQRQNYLQPYNGGHAPLPAASRELLFNVSYSF